jgi:hypothetical protein
MGRLAIFPSWGVLMGPCADKLAVHGPSGYSSFMGCANGPLCKPELLEVRGRSHHVPETISFDKKVTTIFLLGGASTPSGNCFILLGEATPKDGEFGIGNFAWDTQL